MESESETSPCSFLRERNYIRISFAILSQRIHRLLYGRQIRLSVLRKEVNIGIFAVLDHLFDDGAQQAAFFLQRC